ncbi:hypothetical protein GCM10011608_51400 [Micromonospora sonchi]|uniref:Uncharacterized protein n=1 Tax=Micromonospora sonchi TaxID=1763543 RepID=A0A917U6Y5_9ACTN|nr:hypothetical protein GCM10011608_51400 [Micromonospora sonchi]
MGVAAGAAATAAVRAGPDPETRTCRATVIRRYTVWHGCELTSPAVTRTANRESTGVAESDLPTTVTHSSPIS